MCDRQHDSDSSRMDADTACWRGSLRLASRSRRRYYARCTRPPSLTAISLLYTCSRSAQLRKSGGGDGAGVGGERGGGATRQRPLRVEPGSPRTLLPPLVSSTPASSRNPPPQGATHERPCVRWRRPPRPGPSRGRSWLGSAPRPSSQRTADGPGPTACRRLWWTRRRWMMSGPPPTLGCVLSPARGEIAAAAIWHLHGPAVAQISCRLPLGYLRGWQRGERLERRGLQGEPHSACPRRRLMSR